MTKNFRIGILGGIGPASSALFYSLLVQRLQSEAFVKDNTYFPQIIINSIPAIELTTTECSESDLLDYKNGLDFFKDLDVDIFFMVCNTAHAFLPKILEKSISSRFISMPNVVKTFLETNKVNNISILGTYTTNKSKIYHFENINYIDLTEEELIELGNIVKSFNSSGNISLARKGLLEIVDNLKSRGAEHFLLACTEVSVCLKDTNISSFDTLDLLLEAVIDATKSSSNAH